VAEKWPCRSFPASAGPFNPTACSTSRTAQHARKPPHHADLTGSAEPARTTYVPNALTIILKKSFHLTRASAPRTGTPQQPLPPPRKQWYDKLADVLLGDDEPHVNAAASRYALICQKCFTHNGLVKEDMWEDARTYPRLCFLSRRVDGRC
jgi:hypothetical protein